MLKPAILFKDEIQRKYAERWYKANTKYYSPLCNFEMKIDADNREFRDFASIDKNGSVIGYISYRVDFCVREASRFGIISFDEGNLEFVRDLYRVFYHTMIIDKFNRIEFLCINGNPAERGYRNFIKRVGGRIAGTYRQNIAFSDGTRTGSTEFEILHDDLNHEELGKIIKRMGIGL